MVNKKIVIIATFIMLILVGLIAGYKVYKMSQEEKYKETEVEQKTAKNAIKETNTVNEISNNTIDNTTTDNTLDAEENTTTNTTTNTSGDKISNTTSSNTTNSGEPQRNSSTEDIALQLAKEKWNNKNTNVYFFIEEKGSDGIYTISVRDSDTTEELTTYKVDTTTKKVTEI